MPRIAHGHENIIIAFGYHLYLCAFFELPSGSFLPAGWRFHHVSDSSRIVTLLEFGVPDYSSDRHAEAMCSLLQVLHLCLVLLLP